MKYIAILSAFTLLARTTHAQQLVLTTAKNDFTPIETFFTLGDAIASGTHPSADAWSTYFSIPVVSLFSHAPGFDSAVFVADMAAVFAKGGNVSGTLTDEQQLMVSYRNNEAMIKSAITQLKRQNVDDSIRRLLYPYLPKGLQTDSLLPRQLYLFLDEGNGGLPGYVFNSMLQSAQVLPYKSCIIAAHESYHSIVGGVFSAKAAPAEALSDEDKTLLFFLEQVAEEGIADQIDKPLLGEPASPLYGEVKKLEDGEDTYAVHYITRLDSLLRTAARNHKTPGFDFADFSKNTGHIPGRYMVARIREGGLMAACIESAGNPVEFVEAYAKAAERVKGAPRLSDESLAYLKLLEGKWNHFPHS